MVQQVMPNQPKVSQIEISEINYFKPVPTNETQSIDRLLISYDPLILAQRNPQMPYHLKFVTRTNEKGEIQLVFGIPTERHVDMGNGSRDDDFNLIFGHCRVDCQSCSIKMTIAYANDQNPRQSEILDCVRHEIIQRVIQLNQGMYVDQCPKLPR